MLQIYAGSLPDWYLPCSLVGNGPKQLAWYRHRIEQHLFWLHTTYTIETYEGREPWDTVAAYQKRSWTTTISG